MSWCETDAVTLAYCEMWFEKDLIRERYEMKWICDIWENELIWERHEQSALAKISEYVLPKVQTSTVTPWETKKGNTIYLAVSTLNMLAFKWCSHNRTPQLNMTHMIQ